jgi:hypothetical protein
MKQNDFLICMLPLMLLACGKEDAKTEQTILFDALPAKISTDAPFTLEATASSGLPVAFTGNDPSIASVSGNTVTIHKAGNVYITASQSGNERFYEAPGIMRMLTVLHADPDKKNQTITFDFGDLREWKISDGILGLSDYAVASSGLPVTFESSRPAAATVNRETGELSVVWGAERQTVMIYAIQGGNSEYNPAPVAARPLSVFCDRH